MNETTSPSPCAADAALPSPARGEGNLALYVYSTDVTAVGSSNYLYYTGSNVVVKAFQAQFMYAKAVGKKVCLGYTTAQGSSAWTMGSVAVADANGWPFQ